MIKTITQIGNSHGIIFDSTLLQLAQFKPGGEVNVEITLRRDDHANAHKCLT